MNPVPINQGNDNNPIISSDLTKKWKLIPVLLFFVLISVTITLTALLFAFQPAKSSMQIKEKYISDSPAMFFTNPIAYGTAGEKVFNSLKISTTLSDQGNYIKNISNFYTYQYSNKFIFIESDQKPENEFYSFYTYSEKTGIYSDTIYASLLNRVSSNAQGKINFIVSPAEPAKLKTIFNYTYLYEGNYQIEFLIVDKFGNFYNENNYLDGYDESSIQIGYSEESGSSQITNFNKQPQGKKIIYKFNLKDFASINENLKVKFNADFKFKGKQKTLEEEKSNLIQLPITQMEMQGSLDLKNYQIKIKFKNKLNQDTYYQVSLLNLKCLTYYGSEFDMTISTQEDYIYTFKISSACNSGNTELRLYDPARRGYITLIIPQTS
jgi:hypothetical protein